MKCIRTKITSVCFLLALGACDNAPVDASKVETVPVVSPSLASGIEKANLDGNVRPQDNFYQYINGGWLKANEIPADKTAIGSFYDLRDKADEDVKAIIEQLAAAENLTPGTDEQKVADLFRSFMATFCRYLKPLQHWIPRNRWLNF